MVHHSAFIVFLTKNAKYFKDQVKCEIWDELKAKDNTEKWRKPKSTVFIYSQGSPTPN